MPLNVLLLYIYTTDSRTAVVVVVVVVAVRSGCQYSGIGSSILNNTIGFLTVDRWPYRNIVSRRQEICIAPWSCGKLSHPIFAQNMRIGRNTPNHGPNSIIEFIRISSRPNQSATWTHIRTRSKRGTVFALQMKLSSY